MRTLAVVSLALAMATACGPKAAVPKQPDPPAGPPPFTWASFPRVDIIDAGYLMSPADLANAPGIEDKLAAAGVPADQIAGVLSGSEETTWPGPFANGDQRYANAGEIALMRSRQVTYLDNDLVLVAVLADENQHLKPEARPQHDFFAVFMEWGLQPIDRIAPRPGSQLDASQYPAVKIVDPDRLFPYAGIRYLDRVQDTLLAAGVPETALESIYNRSEEIGWPRGLRYDRRPGNAALITTYKARKIAELGSNVLLLIPADENQHMPDGLRPAFDFYFLVEASGVAKP